MKKVLNPKTLVTFIFFTFVASTIYIAVRLILAPSGPASPDMEVRVKSEYVLMLLQCILGIAAMLLPGILEHKVRINIPSGMVVAFAVFLFCAIYLGEVHNFYFRIPHWDTMLHTFSGAALGAIGLSIIGILNKSESVPVSLNPAFIAIFAFCFAVAAGVAWEIYEFSMDFFAGTNTQKFITESGELLIGQAALADTMKDLIVDSLGALAVSIFGYVSMKREGGWLERMQLRRSSQTPPLEPTQVPQPAFAQSPLPKITGVQPAVAIASEQKQTA